MQNATYEPKFIQLWFENEVLWIICGPKKNAESKQFRILHNVFYISQIILLEEINLGSYDRLKLQLGTSRQ
jgi:hypothetical protein